MAYSHAHNAHEGFPSFPEIVEPLIDRARTIGSAVMGELTGMTERFRDHAAKSEDAVGPMTVLTNPDDKSERNGDDPAHSGELYSDRDKSGDKEHRGRGSSGNGHEEN